MKILLKNELVSVPDLRHRLRQLRWFRASFRTNARLVTENYGAPFEIDEKKLTRAFLGWVETINAQKGYAGIDRKDFIVFAAGLVLCELIREQPAKALPRRIGARPADTSMREIVDFWPEGFLYTNFCIGAVAAVFQQEFGETRSIDRCADDLRTWWSYKENIAEMPSYAIAFLDKFLGMEPNWLVPDIASARAAIRKALGEGPPSEALGDLYSISPKIGIDFRKA
ncbi:hypothetical protein [Phyllobacterium phragmitis]|uniref:Uncharacterized protein n=1 Tax=Phyllobacterium phragmitis TaxID=2670329 RepID=A0ABQ0H2F7_9HYPH